MEYNLEKTDLYCLKFYVLLISVTTGWLKHPAATSHNQTKPERSLTMDNNNLNDFAPHLKELENELIFLHNLLEQMSYTISNMMCTCVRAGGRRVVPLLKG